MKKTIKPWYKRGWVIFLGIIFLLIFLAGIMINFLSEIEQENGNKINKSLENNNQSLNENLSEEIEEEPQEENTTEEQEEIIPPPSQPVPTLNDCISLGCPEDTAYVGSKESDKYHYCDCRWVDKILPENLICFKSKEDAQSQGYIPCGTCHPPS